MWRFCDLPSSVWESVASGGPRAGLVQVAVAESDAAFSDPRTATRLGLERIGTYPAQHTEGRGELAGRGPSPSRAGARRICGPGRTGCAPPSRKRCPRGGSGGSGLVRWEPVLSTPKTLGPGLGVAVTRSVRKRPKELGHLR